MSLVEDALEKHARVTEGAKFQSFEAKKALMQIVHIETKILVGSRNCLVLTIFALSNVPHLNADEDRGGEHCRLCCCFIREAECLEK